MQKDWIELIKFVISIITPLIAGYIGIRYGLKQIRVQRRLDFVEKQLKEFYSPLLGMHKEIRAKSELRLKVEQVGYEVSKQQISKGLTPDIKPTDGEIQYNNQQLEKEFLPLYNKMLIIFRENYWLAEQETKEFYSRLVEYVEVWNRWFNQGIWSEVARKIEHTEEKLKPFYRELEIRTDILRKELSSKK